MNYTNPGDWQSKHQRHAFGLHCLSAASPLLSVRIRKVLTETWMHSSTWQTKLPVNRSSKLLGCVYLQRPQPVVAGQAGSQVAETPVLVSGAGHDGLAMADLTQVQPWVFIAFPHLQ